MVVGSIPTVGEPFALRSDVVVAPLAQWIARWTSNPKVAGSSPAGGNDLSAGLSCQKVILSRLVRVILAQGPC